MGRACPLTGLLRQSYQEPSNEKAWRQAARLEWWEKEKRDRRHQREEDFPKKEVLGREPRQDSGCWKATAGLGKAGSYKGRNGWGGWGGVGSGVGWKEREPGELFFLFF